MYFPDYIFETSWEVCNKVGGIYTVLSTKAKTLHDKLKDHIIFLGPDCWENETCPYFIEDCSLFSDWVMATREQGLKLKVGRWDIPGKPLAFIVGYKSFFYKKNEIYGRLWEDFQVDSLHAYGDYDDSAMFAYATAKVVESFYEYYHLNDKKVIFHANEWQTGFAALFLQHGCLEILPELLPVDFIAVIGEISPQILFPVFCYYDLRILVFIEDQLLCLAYGQPGDIFPVHDSAFQEPVIITLVVKPVTVISACSDKSTDSVNCGEPKPDLFAAGTSFSSSCIDHSISLLINRDLS